MKNQRRTVSFFLIAIILITSAGPLFNIKVYAETADSLLIGDFVGDMVLDEERGYIYATVGEDCKLYFINLNDLTVEKQIALSSYAYDMDLHSGKLYLALSIEKKVEVVNLTTQSIEATYQTQNAPDYIAIDGSKMFYVSGGSLSYLYEYDLNTGNEKEITVQGDTYTSYSEPYIVVDEQNHVLYVGESGSSGSNIEAIDTQSYERLHKSTYDDGYGFGYPFYKVILDGNDIFYAGRKFDKNDLSVIHGMYMNDEYERYIYEENIVYVRDNYVITDEYVYDRDRFIRIANLPCFTKRVIMDSQHNIYLYNWDTQAIEKINLDLTPNNGNNYFNLGNVLFTNNIKLYDWVYDESNDKVYALSYNTNRLLFMDADNLTVEEEIYIGSMPSDIEIYNGKLYIPLFGATKIAVVDISLRQIEGFINVEHNPYRIAIDNDKIFYVEEDQHLRLYEYDMNTGTEKEITVVGDTYTSYYEADLVADRENDVLYIGEANLSGSNIEAISTVDYTRLHESTYDDGYGFPYPERKVILDGEDIFYASRKLNKNNLAEILGKYEDTEFVYDEDIIYVNGNYVFSKNAVYDRNTYTKLFNIDISTTPDLVIMDGNNQLYLYYERDNNVHEIYKFDFVEQKNMDYPGNFNAQFNTGGQLELIWDAVEGAEGYNVYYEMTTDPSRPIKLNSTSITDTVYSVVYFEDSWYDNTVCFGATALIDGKETTISYMDTITFGPKTVQELQPPQNFAVSFNDSTGIVNFSWEPVIDADGYNLYYKLLSDDSYTRLNSSTVTETVYETVYMDNWYDNQIYFGISTVLGNEESELITIAYDFSQNTSEPVNNDSDTDNNDSNNDNTNSGEASKSSDDEKTIVIVDEDGSVSLDEIVEKDVNGEETTVEIDEDDFNEIIDEIGNEEEGFKIDVEDDTEKIVVKLPGQSYHRLNGKGEGKKIAINTPNGKYILPADDININDLVSKSDKIIIQIEINKINDEEVVQSIENDKLQIVGQPIDFAVKVVKENEAEEIKSFGPRYVERWISLKEEPDVENTVGIMFDKDKKEYIHVPTKFHKDDNGKYWAVLKRNGNSIYAVVKSEKSFSDIENHWAKEDIELMASKLIVKGINESKFAPGENITRAQYTALLVRALGLTQSDATYISFTDIEENDWYAKAVETAVDMGLVSGYDDGTFKPNKSITREEMAVMTIRALELIEGKQDCNQSNLSYFNDADKIKNWAKDSISVAVKLGLMNGRSEKLFEPSANTTRAESVVLLKRLLGKLDFLEF